MSFVAVAVVGGALISGTLQSNASENAASQAAGSANNATNAQLSMFNTTNAQGAPWRQAGQNALNQIEYGFGTGGSPSGTDTSSGTLDQNAYQSALGNYNQALAQYNNSGQIFDPGAGAEGSGAWVQGPPSSGQAPVMPTPAQFTTQNGVQSSLPQSGSNTMGGIGQGQFNQQFNNSDLNSQLAPNYAWQLSQGLGAQQNSAAGTSGLLSGNEGQAFQAYAQNFAGNAYQNAFNNYNTQQSNIFNRLSTIAGMGSASQQNSANVGATTGQGIANSTIAGGNAQAAGTIGSANAISGAINNATGSYYGLNYLNGGSSGYQAPASIPASNIGGDYGY